MTIALHKISYQRKDMVVNPKHYQRLTVKQSFDIENTLFSEDLGIDIPIQTPSLHVYDELLEEA